MYVLSSVYLMQKHHEQDMHIRAQVVLNAKLLIMVTKWMNVTQSKSTTLTNPIFSLTTNLHLDHLKIQKPIVFVWFLWVCWVFFCCCFVCVWIFFFKNNHLAKLRTDHEITSTCHSRLAGVRDSFMLGLSPCSSWPLQLNSFQNTVVETSD